ncbi:MAG: hypothetical protein NT074_06240 [Methanomicrobiales archaeon]|jgi:hypothetical protein|nr:hypothetical protein [Methanomicrobiales archaeon]
MKKTTSLCLRVLLCVILLLASAQVASAWVVRGDLSIGQIDVWKYIPPASGWYTFNLYGPSYGDFNLFIYDTWTKKWYSAQGKTTKERLRIYAYKGRKLQIEVRDIWGSGEYTLSCSAPTPR